MYLIAIGGKILPFQDSEDSTRYYKYDSFKKKITLLYVRKRIHDLFEIKICIQWFYSIIEAV